MQRLQFMQRNPSLISIYEHNYMLFRLLLPTLPTNDGWHVLESPNRQHTYLHRVSLHAYTSEWLLGHYFTNKTPKKFAPDYVIKIYHDARLAEAILEKTLPVDKIRQEKIKINRALGEWLDYLRRHGYQLSHAKNVLAPPKLIL